MAWLLLGLAGVLEVVWAVGLKYTEGFTRPLPTAVTVVAMIASVYLLGVAVKTLPIGTAYAVWVGVGAAGTAILGIVLFAEPTDPARVGFLLLLVIAVAGLRLTSSG